MLAFPALLRQPLNVNVLLESSLCSASLTLLALLLGCFSASAFAAPLLSGRRRGLSSAGMAVLDVLTLTPERVRWGNAYKGRCYSAYTLVELPPGKGTYPDNLVPPASPTDIRFRVVRRSWSPALASAMRWCN